MQTGAHCNRIVVLGYCPAIRIDILYGVAIGVDITVGDILVAGTVVLVAIRCVLQLYDLAPELNVFHQIKVLGISFQIFHILFDGGVVGADYRILIESKVGKCRNVFR